MTTLNYSQALAELAQKGKWEPVGETTYLSSVDKCVYIGEEYDVEKGGEVPTWKKKIADAALYNNIQDDLEAQKLPRHVQRQRGIEAGVYKADDIYAAFDKSVHDAVNVYATEFVPRLNKGMKLSQINAELKQRGMGAATLSGDTFATLRNTQTEFKKIRYLDRQSHILKDLVSSMPTNSLDPVRFATFEGSDSIKEKVGEFETPTTGLGRYTEHSFTIDKYIGGFNVAPSFFQYDMGRYSNIIGDHLRDQVGEIDEIRNKRVYEIMVGAGVSTVAATGSWSVRASGLNTNDPLKDIRPILYTANTAGRGAKMNFIAMNQNLLGAVQGNTFLRPAVNPNDSGSTAGMPTLVAEDNTIFGPGYLVGLPNLRVGIDNMLTDANSVVVGSSEAIIFSEGPSASRSFVDQRSEVLMRQNKWWFGVYLYDDQLIKRITGAA